MARECGPPSSHRFGELPKLPGHGVLGRPDSGVPIAQARWGCPGRAMTPHVGSTHHRRCGPQGPPSSPGSFVPHGPDGRGAPPPMGQIIGCVGLRCADVLCRHMRVIGKDMLDRIAGGETAQVCSTVIRVALPPWMAGSETAVAMWSVGRAWI